MKHLKTFESLEINPINYSNPITRHIAGRSTDDEPEQVLSNDGCNKCEYYKAKNSSYCGKCSNCLLSKEETKAKMVLAKSDKDKFLLSGCMSKHGLKFNQE